MVDTGFRLLVVEDENTNRRIITEYLKKSGYDVVTAENGYKAIGLLMRSHFDLVVLDIMMPGISGLDVLKGLREAYSAVELPVVMATGRSEAGDMLQAFELGANDYIPKPYKLSAVIARIQQQLRMKAYTRRNMGSEPASSGASSSSLGAGGGLTFATVEPGAVLDERYRLEERIGVGAFGTVYRGMHLGLDHPVAVKVLKEHIGTSKEEVARFQREAITTCRIQHPNAVTMYDFGIAGRGMPYIVMELLVGRSLQGEIDEFQKIDPMRTAQIVVPICDLLSAAHEQGVVHRDLKPGNIFLHESRVGEIVKILDFGIAGLLHMKKNDEKLTRDGGLVGTPTYMAPERLQGQPYDGRSDVYSLGILLYEMLCGHAPFESDVDPVAVMVMHVTELPKPLRESVPEIPQRLEDLVLSMLDKDPSRRPRVDQVGRELGQLFSLDIPRSLRGKGES